jgi:hypothetical protein
MEKIAKIQPKIISNSPIEFVLVAPVRGHDKIIIASDNAGLDIKGLAVDRDTDMGSLRNLSSGMSLILGLGRQLNVLDSHSTDDLFSEYDSRKSSFRFAWVGNCSSFGKRKIEKIFNRSLREIRAALVEEPESDIELVFSPVILSCSIAHQLRLRFRRLLLLTVTTYVLVGVSVAVFGLFFGVLKAS